MMIEIFAVALVVGTLALAVDLRSMWTPPLLRWLRRLHRDLTPLASGASHFSPGPRRSGEPDVSRAVATNFPLAEQKRLADLKTELGKLTTAEHERIEDAGEVAKQEAALAQRERILERSLADAERSAAEATARIEALEADIATREAELQQQESEPADRHPPVAEHDVIRTRAVPKTRDEGPGGVESDWWEKQLGPPRSPKE
jgi:hypothetical protein